MAGYGPSTTSFSLALKRTGDRLEARFGDEVEVRYVYNILDLGYRGLDILWLVEEGILTMGVPVQQLSDRPRSRTGPGGPAIPVQRQPERPRRHGRGAWARADGGDRSSDRLPHTRLLRKRSPAHLQPGTAGPLAGGLVRPV